MTPESVMAMGYEAMKLSLLLGAPLLLVALAGHRFAHQPVPGRHADQ
jgi:hypothetical protein